jgi:hypothetical protein
MGRLREEPRKVSQASGLDSGVSKLLYRDPKRVSGHPKRVSGVSKLVSRTSKRVSTDPKLVSEPPKLVSEVSKLVSRASKLVSGLWKLVYDTSKLTRKVSPRVSRASKLAPRASILTPEVSPSKPHPKTPGRPPCRAGQARGLISRLQPASETGRRRPQLSRGAASWTSRAARLPESRAPSMVPLKWEVCSPAKCTRPSTLASSGSHSVSCPGFHQA